MPHIDFQFSKSRGIFSNLISWYDKGLCTHVDIICDDGQLLGARMLGGFIKRPPNYKKFSRKIFISIHVTKKQYDDFWKAAESQIGAKYDWLSILSFFLNRNWRQKGKWICSEIVTWLCEQARMIYPIPEGLNKIDPENCLLILSQWGRLL